MGTVEAEAEYSSSPATRIESQCGMARVHGRSDVKRYSAILALLVLMAASTYLTPAQAALNIRSRYDHMLTLRMKEKWLLPSVQLPNANAAYVLDFDHRLRLFTNGTIVRNIEKVDFNLQGTPFAVDTLKNRDQARALVQLGMLATMGHFAILNANDDRIRVGAVQIMNELADISDHFKLGNLSSQYQRLATDVGDPRFAGGPSPIVARYDATVNALYDWVASSYGVDGHWFFMYGNAVAGLYALTAGGDRFNCAYNLSVLDDLYHSRPVHFDDPYATGTLAVIAHDDARDTELLCREAWASLEHFVNGNAFYANPRSGKEHFEPDDPNIFVRYL